MTKDEQKQKLDRFSQVAERCQAASVPVVLDSDDQAAVTVADNFIRRIRQGGKRGGSTSSAAKTEANRENAKKKRVRKPKA